MVPGIAPDCVLSTNENAAPVTGVSPNPFTDLLRISNVTDGTVKIYDAFGKQVYGQHVEAGASIATSGFSTGLYVLSFESESRSFTAKIIKL